MSGVREHVSLQQVREAIDHTKLTFAPGEDETAAIEQLCAEARQHGFYAVCVRPRHVALSKRLLAGSKVQVATVIGFPADKVQLEAERQHPTVGQVPLADKVAETRQAVADGVDELDLVMSVAALKQESTQEISLSGQSPVLAEFSAVREAAQGRPVKVIIETDLLTPAEMVRATQYCAQARVAMVKTSTGMVAGGQGATLEAVRLIQRTLQEAEAPLGIKASGGVKNVEQAAAFLNLGVQRLGTSSGVAIMQGGAVAADAY